jgi:hypothetical protein
MFYHAHRAVSIGFFDVVHVDRSPAYNKIRNLFTVAMTMFRGSLLRFIAYNSCAG